MTDEMEVKFRELRSFIRDEVGDMRSDLRERMDGIHTRLDVLNGRTRTSELAIAVLNDRSERAEHLAQQVSAEANAHARVWGGGAGAFVGGVVIAAWKYLAGH